MSKAMDIAKYFINKDTEKELFNKTLIAKNGRCFYEGNARLNKFLHLAQNIYLAKTGTLLFEDELYAYDNGAVIPEIQEHYAVLLSKAPFKVNLPDDKRDFLDRFFVAFKNADIDELIDLSHEDSEWEEHHGSYRMQDQKMDTLSKEAEYKEQYADIINVMERIS